LQPTITDLRTPTPFTFTNAVTGISECETAPTTLIHMLTAVVNGSTFTPFGPGLLVFSSASAVTDFFTYPDLIMTNLIRGEEISLVRDKTNYVLSV